jgi:hypothetical protein
VVASQGTWPDWWDWELDASNPHLAKRMIDRGFSETDLREMLDTATGFRPDGPAGRWIIETSHAGRTWEVVVEPNVREQRLVVVTAYPVG